MTFSGYGQKMDIFIKRILEHLTKFKIDPKLFEIIKEKNTRSMKSYRTQKLYNLTTYYIKLLTRDLHWSFNDLISAMNKITAEAVEDYIKFFFSTLRAEALAYGNLNPGMVKNACKMFEDTLVSTFQTIPLPPYANCLIRNVALDEGCHYRLEAINDVQKTKICQFYFEVCFDNLAEHSKLMLVQQILKEPCFNNLRTNEALGYIVMCNSCRDTGVGALNLLVQSDYSTAYLDSRIEAFLNKMIVSPKIERPILTNRMALQGKIEKMSEEDFKSEKTSLISKLLKKKKSMAATASDLFAEICDEEYNFQRKEMHADFVKEIQKEEFVEFYRVILCLHLLHLPLLSLWFSRNTLRPIRLNVKSWQFISSKLIQI